MGVFTDKSICLDRRLKDHLDICDLVLRLFDIIEEALEQLIDPDESPQDNDSDGSCEDSANDPLEINDIYARRYRDIFSPTFSTWDEDSKVLYCEYSSRTARIRSFAEQSNLSDFESLARLAIDTLYPDSNESLRIQLARSMFETCASVLYKMSHQHRMNTPRWTQEAQVPTMSKESDEAASYIDKMEAGLQKSVYISKQTRESTALESAPSVLDSLRTKVLKKILDPPSRIGSDCGISSVQVGKVTYPHPPRVEGSGYGTCE
ncbi:hypothetical protein TWF506_004325 [Arthrobotrys conoides]|uniref:Uncharacterized protein n=1 Tax=Arthrobotrys conoides TaxID=74498 RepID=A0AAN8RP93_9PEZI